MVQGVSAAVWPRIGLVSQLSNFCFIQSLKTSIKLKGSFRVSHFFLKFQDDPFKIKSGGMVDMKKLKERGKDRWVSEL